MAWKHAAGWVAVATLVLAGCTAAPRAPTAPGPRSTPAPASHAAWQRAGPPPKDDAELRATPYFIDVFNGHAQVVDSVTGKVTATIRRPEGGLLTGAAAAGDDRTFVLAVDPSRTAQLSTRYDELRLDRQGIPGPLSPLAVPPIGGGQQLPFAVSQDGSELAISDLAASPSARGQVVVVSLAAGTTRTWRSPVRGGAENLSWAGNTRLAFDWRDDWRHPLADPHAGLWLLDTGSPGHNLFAASRLLVPASLRFGPYTGAYDPLITLDGSALFAAMTTGGYKPRVVVVEFSARTGHLRRAVTPPATESGQGAWCGALWADPSGHHALASCYFLFRVDHGRFTRVWLRSPGVGAEVGNNFFAW